MNTHVDLSSSFIHVICTAVLEHVTSSRLININICIHFIFDKKILFNIFSPSMADSSSFPVEEGDVIMLGTDGLFDNLSEDMLLRHISQLQVGLYKSTI